ncbi:MAG: hypothetical protein Q7S99_03070 [Parvibaculum sp.]|nr:hypothetical protein [Parvibaculum sp.]
MTASQKITLAIAKELIAGRTAAEAFDAVLGSGSWEKLASDLYDTMNTSAAHAATKH